MGVSLAGGGAAATLQVQEDGTPLAQQPPVLNFTGAGTATTGSGKYNVAIPVATSSGGAIWQFPDFTIFYDGTNYSARRESDATVPYTSNTSLHNVFNSVSTELGTGTTFLGTGGLVVFSRPSSNVMSTTQPCQMQNQMTLFGPGRGFTIQASGTAGWSAGTRATPKAIIDANQKSRVRVEGLRLDGSTGTGTPKPGTTGILFEKGGGSTGGNSAHSYFLFNEVTGFDVSGIQIGLEASAGATSTAWLFGNQVVNDMGNSNTAVGVAFFVGDAHYGWGNNIKMGGGNSICMVIQANSVHVLDGGHMVNNGASTQPLIQVNGANPCRITGVYFDNLNGPAVGLNLDAGAPYTWPMSGQTNRVVIAENWCHGTASTAISPFTLNNTQGGGNNVSGITIADNIMEADTTAFASIVDITNGSSSAKIQNTMSMTGNQAKNCTNFVTADNGPGVTAGVYTATGTFVGGSMNIIQDTATTQRKGP